MARPRRAAGAPSAAATSAADGARSGCARKWSSRARTRRCRSDGEHRIRARCPTLAAGQQVPRGLEHLRPEGAPGLLDLEHLRIARCHLRRRPQEPGRPAPGLGIAGQEGVRAAPEERQSSGELQVAVRQRGPQGHERPARVPVVRGLVQGARAEDRHGVRAGGAPVDQDRAVPAERQDGPDRVRRERALDEQRRVAAGQHGAVAEPDAGRLEQKGAAAQRARRREAAARHRGGYRVEVGVPHASRAPGQHPLRPVHPDPVADARMIPDPRTRLQQSVLGRHGDERLVLDDRDALILERASEIGRPRIHELPRPEAVVCPVPNGGARRTPRVQPGGFAGPGLSAGKQMEDTGPEHPGAGERPLTTGFRYGSRSHPVTRRRTNAAGKLEKRFGPGMSPDFYGRLEHALAW